MTTFFKKLWCRVVGHKGSYGHADDLIPTHCLRCKLKTYIVDEGSIVSVFEGIERFK